MAQLIVEIEGQAPVVHELTDGAVTIGRETGNTIVILDPSVSRRHAEIPASDGPRTLRDLNSANGTAVNWEPITEKLLKPGDVIHFGVVQATFVIKAKAAAPAPTLPPRPTAPVAPPPAMPVAFELPPPPPVSVEQPTPPAAVLETPTTPPLKIVAAAPPPPPVAVVTPPAPVERQLPPAETVKESPPASTVPTVPAVQVFLPVVAKAPPLALPAPPLLARLPMFADKVPTPVEKVVPPAAEFPVPPAPAAPPPVVARLPVPVVLAAPAIVAKAPEPAPIPARSPLTPEAVPPPAVGKPPLPPPVTPTASTPAPVPIVGLPVLPADCKPTPIPAAKPPAPAAAKLPSALQIPAPAVEKPTAPVAVPVPPPAAAKPTPSAIQAPLPAAEPPLPAAPKPPLPTPASKHWRPEPVARERSPKPGATKDLLPTLVVANDLPLVPTDLGQKPPASGASGQPIPAFTSVRERQYAPDSPPSFFARHRVPVAALALALIAAATGAFLRNRPAPPPKVSATAVPKAPVVAGVESTPVASKRFWDQMQAIAHEGLKQAQSIPFKQYPVMSSGMYDFQLIDDDSLDALMASLTTRSRGLARIAEEISLLDKTNVDPELVAFSKKLGAHWQRASSLDSDAVNVVWAVHERRARPAATPTPALESADVVPAESHAPGATPVTMDQVSQLANGWLMQRNYFVQVGLEVDASEKAMHRQLAERYADQFK